MALSGGAIRRNNLARVWGNALYRVVFADDDADRSAFCCTASFCSHVGDKSYERQHGLLSQWRGYGKGGRILPRFLIPPGYGDCSNRNGERSFTLTPIYAKPSIRERLQNKSNASRSFSNTSAAVVKTALLEDRDFSVDQTLLPFVSSATAFKHQGFYEEREVRLVAMPWTERAAEVMRKEGHQPAPLKEVYKTSRDGRERRISRFSGRTSRRCRFSVSSLALRGRKTLTPPLRGRLSVEKSRSQNRQRRTLADRQR